MGFLDKVKNMFIEELEDEDVIKKEVIQVKIPQPVEQKKQTKVEHKEPVKEEIKQPRIYDEYAEKEEVIKPMPVQVEEPVISKPPLPNFFDDSDFEAIDKPESTIVKQEYKYTKTTETIPTPVITGYNGKKNEDTKKVFQPTPIISPVYGVLDKNYRKDEIATKKKPRTIYSEFDKVDVDDIRKKAYGTLEDELESNLTSRDTFVFNDEDLIDEDEFAPDTDNYDEQPIDIFGELEKTDAKKDALDDLLNNFEFKPKDIYDDKAATSLIEEELNKNYDRYEEELNKSYTRELNDSDLFNLIDSMYDKRDGE